MAEEPRAAAPPGDGGRTGYPRTLGLGLVSAAMTAVGVAQPWESATATVRHLPTIQAEVDGADLAPLAGALGFVLLAAFGAVIATRGWVRRAVGAVVVVCAAAVIVAVVHPADATHALEQGLSAKGWSGGSYRVGASLWRWVAGLGAAGCLVAGLLVSRFGGAWATMSSRYDAPAAAEQQRGELVDPTEADLWRSIDRGHDPTRTRRAQQDTMGPTD